MGYNHVLNIKQSTRAIGYFWARVLLYVKHFIL
jgi:hypothetical protein